MKKNLDMRMTRNDQVEFERRMGICRSCPEFERTPVPGVCKAEPAPLQAWCKRKWETKEMTCPRGRYDQKP